ncbi:MAG: glycosyltransferase family 2 protein [Elusimicrobiales bacterium]|jgi:glycosyltransferase involved in cell wall biosynthesis
MTENSPLVCVCVPAYNSEATIAESLSSILDQTYANLIVMMVDNASTDATVKIAEKIAEKDRRLRIIRNPVNLGGEGNFTCCINLAGGEYTAIYHADDVYDPEIIEREVRFLEEHKEAGAVFCAARDIDETGRVIAARKLPSEGGIAKGGVFDFQQVFRTALKMGNFMVFPSAMVRTRVYKDEIKAWDPEHFSTSADLDVWLRIAERHPLGFINIPLMKYRVSASSYSYNFARLKTTRHAIFLVLDFYLKKYSGSFIGQSEMTDYRLLLLKDDINIAINLLIKGERACARRLLAPALKPENIRNSLRSRGQTRILAIGLAAWVLSLVPLGAQGRNFLARVRHNG